MPSGFLNQLGIALVVAGMAAAAQSELPTPLRVVLEHTHPLAHPRAGRLPLLVLPISQSLAGVDSPRAEEALRELDRRGIAYSVAWNPGDLAASAREALRIGALQQRLGMEVVADATSCLQGFFDGSDATLHIDDDGKPFAETSFGGRLGCPFALEPRLPVIAARVEGFVREYQRAGVRLDLVFADWEIDGPIEWNDAWANSKRCRRCREKLPGLDAFPRFQARLREIRSDLQRRAFASPVLARFPQALVGNYAVHPHDGYRRWYDYFEREAPWAPSRTDQRARYRVWAPEFEAAGYTLALPVIYPWYPIFGWYDFPDPDYRWFYNLLLEGSAAGRHTPPSVPLIPFVHWNTTAPPEPPDPRVRPFGEDKYRALLWHLLLRGHDTFFLWCLPSELAREIELVHGVYAGSLAHRGFLERGEPVRFDVPPGPAPVVSGLRLGDRVLALRTDFGEATHDVALTLPDGRRLAVPEAGGPQVLELAPPTRPAGSLTADGRPRFPIGFYELPASDADLRALAGAGVNLVRCRNRGDLDRAQGAGMLGWVPLPVQEGPSEALRRAVLETRDHPALAAWEGPDEIVWLFTAYSGLETSAGFTRADWERQSPEAVAHAAAEAARLFPRMREAIDLVRSLDSGRHPFWINEAVDSDAAYVRDYVGSIDITGCDYYPVRSTGTDLPGIGRAVDRWRAIGRGKPVWMVLQAFSWHAVRAGRDRRYPTFEESRFMAYDALVHGAAGLLYWGSSTIDDAGFRASLHALTTELAALESWWLAPAVDGVDVRLIANVTDPPDGRVRATLRRRADRADYLLLVVNEDDRRHLGVEVTGLEALDGRTLRPLPGGEPGTVAHGSLLVRLQPFEVRVLTTDPAQTLPLPPGGGGRGAARTP